MLIDAKDRFLARRKAHRELKLQEARLRDKAAAVAELHFKGHTALCTRITNSIPEEERAQFKRYLEEYCKLYENE